MFSSETLKGLVEKHLQDLLTIILFLRRSENYELIELIDVYLFSKHWVQKRQM